MELIKHRKSVILDIEDSFQGWSNKGIEKKEESNNIKCNITPQSSDRIC